MGIMQILKKGHLLKMNFIEKLTVNQISELSFFINICLGIFAVMLVV